MGNLNFLTLQTFFSFWLDKASFKTKEEDNKIERLKPLHPVVKECGSSFLKIWDRRTVEVDLEIFELFLLATKNCSTTPPWQLCNRHKSGYLSSQS